MRTLIKPRAKLCSRIYANNPTNWISCCACGDTDTEGYIFEDNRDEGRNSLCVECAEAWAIYDVLTADEKSQYLDRLEEIEKERAA